MNIAERDRLGTEVEPATGSAERPTGGAGLRPLLSLKPYLLRYRGQALAALIALLVAAVTTLVVPIAIRRMIDFGFSRESTSLIDSYFAVLIGVVAVLALASAARFYLVTTLGERIVADLREQVFAHLISLSPAFFDRAKSGELISRLTADTTQIKAAVGASISIALRNLVLFVGAAVMMVFTSPRLSAFVLAVIPVIVLPLYGFGRSVRRRSRVAQDTLADATAYASELIGAVRVVQASTNEKVAASRFGAAVERAFVAARDSIRSRAVLTAIAIFLVFASVVVVLWVGAQDVLDGRISAGRLSQFVLYAVFAAARARSACGSLGRGFPGVRRGRAAVRDPRGAAGDRPAGAAGDAPAAAARRGHVHRCSLRLSDAAVDRGARRCLVRGARRREARHRRPIGRRQEHGFPSHPAVL